MADVRTNPEWWNAGPPEADQKDNTHFNFIVNPAGGGTINLSEA
jgi:hypothetical protein